MLKKYINFYVLRKYDESKEFLYELVENIINVYLMF